MSSAGRAVSTNGCVTKPRARAIGLRSCFVQIQSSSLTGSYVMATAEQREPYESRGSRTVLGEPGGESPPGHSTHDQGHARLCWWCCRGAPEVGGRSPPNIFCVNERKMARMKISRQCPKLPQMEPP